MECSLLHSQAENSPMDVEPKVGSSAEGGVAGTSVLASVAENSEVSVSERKGAFMNLPPIYKLYPLTVVSPLHSQANDPVDAMDVEPKGDSASQVSVFGKRTERDL